MTSAVRDAQNKRFHHRISVCLLVQKFLFQEISRQRNTKKKKVNRAKADYDLELSLKLKEHGNLRLNSHILRTKDLEGVRNVEVSKILTSFGKLLIMHKCVTSIHPIK